MEIEEDDLEKKQAEILKNIFHKIKAIAVAVKGYSNEYLKHRKELLQLSSSVLEKVAAGSLVTVFLPEDFGWKPAYAFCVALLCFLFSAKFLIDSKKE